MSEAQQQASGQASDAERRAALAAAILKASQPPATTAAPIPSDYVDAPYRPPVYIPPPTYTPPTPDYTDTYIREEIAQTPGTQTPETYTTPPPATTPSGREIDYGEPIIEPTPTTPSGREIDYGATPTYTVTTPDGETETFNDYMEAQTYAVKNSPIVVTTVDEAGNEAIHTFKDVDDAELYIERLDQNTMVSDTRGIPGPALGPRQGSIGEGVSKYLSGGLQTLENNFENVARYIRQLSSDSWIRAAEAKNANDVVGTITGGSLAVSERILAGLYEGATFIVRPVQWGQLAATPVLVASDPAGYAKAMRQDLGGLVLEGVGAYAGGFLAGKSLNYGIDLAKGVYNRSEFAQLQKLHPIDADTPIDWSSNEKFGQLPETSYSAADPLKRLRGRWSSKPMYSSLVPVMDLDRVILNPKLILRLDPAALGAVTSLSTINRVSVKPTVQSIDVETLPIRVTPGVVSPSVRTVTRQEAQVDAVKIVPITKLVDETFTPQGERVGVETRSGVVIIPDQTVEVTPTQTQPVAPIQEQDVDVTPTPVEVQKQKQEKRLPVKQGKVTTTRREEERRREVKAVAFVVRQRYGRKTVSSRVEAQTFREALVKALRGSPAEVEVRRTT